MVDQYRNRLSLTVKTTHILSSVRHAYPHHVVNDVMTESGTEKAALEEEKLSVLKTPYSPVECNTLSQLFRIILVWSG